MKLRFFCLAAILSVLSSSRAEVHVISERNGDAGATGAFQFKSIRRPARNDGAREANFSLLSGRIDANSGGLNVLNDGKVPGDEDIPRMNFFFAAGTEGGRLLVNLEKVVSIAEIRSFSWHPGERGPQVYKVYAIDQAPADTNAAQKGDLESLGWRLLAKVDTRTTDAQGGQFAVSIKDSAGLLGRFQYLIFDISPTEQNDPFGNTFFSEIDVIGDGSKEEPEEVAAAATSPKQVHFGNYHLTIDTSAAPDLSEWTENKLVPVVKEWYPKLVELLASEGYQAPTNIGLRFRDDMRGTPASAGGSRINCNAEWFRKNLEGEAIGAVVHEMAHVVQNYGWGRRNNPKAARVPGWIVEGIPDYIRWFLYEPESHGAEITSRNLARARYDANYRISANFLDWVARKYGRATIWKINAAARAGNYTENLWQELTGKSVADLGTEWKTEHEKRLGDK